MAANVYFSDDTFRNGAAACWVTVTCWVSVPAVTVIMAVREEVAVFSVTVNVTAPLFMPDAGLTVHQVWFEATVQLWLLVIVKLLLPADAGILKVFDETSSVLSVPCCSIVTCFVSEPAVKVSIAVRMFTVVLDEKEKLMVPLLAPD